MSLVDLGKKLLEAAKGGRDDEVRELMTGGAPFTTDWLGSSPLHWAAKHGHVSTAEVLLRAGVSRDARTKVDRTPLHMACQEGHLQVAEVLLAHGADIDAQDMLKMTPLHWAVERQHADVVSCLLRHGADVVKLNKFEKSCLGIARDHNNAVLLKLLSTTMQIKNGGNSSLALKSSPVTTASTSFFDVSNTIKTTTTAMHPRAKITTSGGKISAVELGLKGNTSSTSVLATLAALAEASAPLKSAGTASGALSWLQDASISIQANQTYTLTEAGRLALNLTKPKEKTRKPRKPSTTRSTSSLAAGDMTLHQVMSSGGCNKVITIVSTDGQSDISASDLSSIQTVIPDDGASCQLPVAVDLESEVLQDERICIVSSEEIVQQVEGNRELVVGPEEAEEEQQLIEITADSG